MAAKILRCTQNYRYRRPTLQRAIGDLSSSGAPNISEALPLARSVLPGGRVLAVDLQPPMLAMLLERAADAGLDNIEPIEAEVDNPHLPPESCDLVLMVDVYHELSHPVRVMKHVKHLSENNQDA